ncbi:MAG TPA: NfeD family protein, partial [Rhodothermales bacterium]
VFVIPGFGVAGIGGLVLIVASLIAALIGNVGLSFPSGAAISSAVLTMAVTLVLLVILAFSLGRYLPKSQRFSQLVLMPDLSSGSGFISSEPVDHLLGSVGTTVTPLRPGGAVDISGERVEVTSGGEFIPAGTPVQVVRVHGARVEVRRVHADAGTPSETSAE